MAVTIRDIAQELGVSHTTVSRALNGRGAEFISEATRQRVLATAQRLGYRPNRAARALVTGRTQMIGLLVPAISTAYPMHVIQAAHRYIAADGYLLIVAGMDTAAEAARFKEGINWSVDGLMVLGDMQETLDRFVPVNSDRAVVQIEVSSDRYDMVVSDKATGARECAQHLHACGAQHVTLLADAYVMEHGSVRFDTFHEWWRHTGRQTSRLMADVREPDSATRAVYQMAVNRRLGDAIFCYNDEMAVGALRGARAAGLRVPDDLQIVGHDDLTIAAFVDPPLTTITMDIDTMVATAWSFLKHRLETPDGETQRAVRPTRLIPRGSTRLPGRI